MDRFIREPECRRLTGLSRTTRWHMERRGLFPARRRLSVHAVGWLESELHAWLESRAAGLGHAPTQPAQLPARVRAAERKAVSSDLPQRRKGLTR
jgi:prophage regulatory protein